MYIYRYNFSTHTHIWGITRTWPWPYSKYFQGDETSPHFTFGPTRPRALEAGAVFWRCKQLLQSLVAPLSLQGLAKLGDENWTLEGHLRWSVLFNMFVICKVRRYLPLFAVFTNLRTDKSLRTIWFILGCYLLIRYWGGVTHKLTIILIKSAQENGTKQDWHQWMFAVFVLISNFELTYLMISRILCHGQPNTWRKKWGGIQTNHVNSEEHTWRIHELVHFMRHRR